LSLGFLISGIFIYITKYFKKGSRNINNIDAILIGIAQGFSVFSSISRSGITISLGMIRQIDHTQLVRFSFLLSIPAILGGSVFDFVLMDSTQLSAIGEIPFSSYIVGFLSSAIVGYLTIKLLINIINRGKLYYFAYYCLGLAAILLIYSFIMI
jgi:undecaprenyl-diphosphatase